MPRKATNIPGKQKITHREPNPNKSTSQVTSALPYWSTPKLPTPTSLNLCPDAGAVSGIGPRSISVTTAPSFQAINVQAQSQGGDPRQIYNGAANRSSQNRLVTTTHHQGFLRTPKYSDASSMRTYKSTQQSGSFDDEEAQSFKRKRSPDMKSTMHVWDAGGPSTRPSVNVGLEEKELVTNVSCGPVGKKMKKGDALPASGSGSKQVVEARGLEGKYTRTRSVSLAGFNFSASPLSAPTFPEHNFSSGGGKSSSSLTSCSPPSIESISPIVTKSEVKSVSHKPARTSRSSATISSNPVIRFESAPHILDNSVSTLHGDTQSHTRVQTCSQSRLQSRSQYRQKAQPQYELQTETEPSQEDKLWYWPCWLFPEYDEALQERSYDDLCPELDPKNLICLDAFEGEVFFGLEI
ncbi:hypothetical protein VKT23_004548 [Stygiomarasmius scandens]|uniref:Uncharacterized protein n=1 Tax=Marasmiellus scandens TaxID=2682957 RepID=A0ABR1K074_9AGAR